MNAWAITKSFSPLNSSDAYCIEEGEGGTDRCFGWRAAMLCFEVCIGGVEGGYRSYDGCFGVEHGRFGLCVGEVEEG